MRIRLFRPIRVGMRVGSRVALGVILATGATAAAETGDVVEGDFAAVESVVRSFNQAVSERDPDAVALHFVDGAVLLNPGPAHAGLGDGGGALATDAVAQWKAIAALLRGGTRSYSRTVADLRVQVDRDLATVWCRVRTETQPLEGDAAMTLEFSETYTLMRVDGSWKIASLANNRPTR